MTSSYGVFLMKRATRLEKPESEASSVCLKSLRPHLLGLSTHSSTMAEAIDFVKKPAIDFIKDSFRLIKRCTKPDRTEFSKIATATSIGFAIMGFIGFFVKIIFIPINNIIVGMS